MNNTILEVDKILNEKSNDNKKELDTALILPFSNDYPFCANGVYFYVGRMGSGKTYGVIRHIMITDRFNKGKGYYDQIVVSATSGSMDKTAKTFMVEAESTLSAFYKLNMITAGKAWADGGKVPMEIEFLKVSPQRALSLTFSAEEPSSFEVNLDILADGEGNLFEIKNIA